MKQTLPLPSALTFTPSPPKNKKSVLYKSIPIVSGSIPPPKLAIDAPQTVAPDAEHKKKKKRFLYDIQQRESNSSTTHVYVRND